MRDLATLARALIHDHPTHYAIYSEKSFRYNDIDQPNRNRLLWRDRTVDGVKTGHTSEAGYCLIASALRDGMRLISVVMGTDSDEARMRESQKLLSYGYRFFETHKLYEPGVMLRTAEVWYGQENEVQLGVAAPVYVTIPRGRYADLKAETDVARVIKAPFAVGDPFGELRVMLDDKAVVKVPLTAQSADRGSGLVQALVAEYLSVLPGAVELTEPSTKVAPRIEFPCDYPVKIVGENRDSFSQDVVELVRRHAPEITDEHVKVRASKRRQLLRGDDHDPRHRRSAVARTARNTEDPSAGSIWCCDANARPGTHPLHAGVPGDADIHRGAHRPTRPTSSGSPNTSRCSRKARPGARSICSRRATSKSCNPTAAVR